MAIDRVGLLTRVPLFADLPKRQLRRLAKQTGVYEYEQGAPLVTEGTQGHTLFVILEGTVKVVRRGRTLRRLGPGEFFGDVAVLDHRPRSASVLAESPVQCMVLHREELRALAEEEPAVAWHLLETLAGRLRGD